MLLTQFLTFQNIFFDLVSGTKFKSISCLVVEDLNNNLEIKKQKTLTANF